MDVLASIHVRSHIDRTARDLRYITREYACNHGNNDNIMYVYDTTRFFSHKNELYKNVEAENCRKFKNVLRMFRGSNSIQH